MTVAGQPTRTADDLFGVLRAAAPGGSLEMTILRGTEERTVQVVLGQDGQQPATEV